MSLGTLTIEQEPVNAASKVPVITNWTPVIGYMIHNDDISGLFYFKLVLEVRKDTSGGTLIAKIKQRRNGYSPDVNADEARAFFDLREIINSQLVNTVFDQNDNLQPFLSIHKIGKNTPAKPFSENGDNRTDGIQIGAFYVKGYQQYSLTANAVPTEDTDDSVDDTLYYLQASLPLMTARSASADYIQSSAFNVYKASSDTDKFLSDLVVDTAPYGLGSVYRNYVYWDGTIGDYHTVAFLNDTTNFDSDIEYIEIQYYKASGAVAAVYIENVSGNGGATPGSVSSNTERLLYFGCGTANLEAMNIDSNLQRPSNAANDNWIYYTVRGSDDASGSNYKTAPYYFIKTGLCNKGYKKRRLAWTNSVGGYDYFNFNMKSTQTTEISRNNYNTLLGKYNSSKFFYNNTMRGINTRQTTAVLKEQLNTDWITENEGILIEKLLMSTNVDIVENMDTEFTQGVVITDSSFIKKTSANNKLIQYTINIEYANPINTNS
jgi:hypothetical protein